MLFYTIILQWMLCLKFRIMDCKKNHSILLFFQGVECDESCLWNHIFKATLLNSKNVTETKIVKVAFGWKKTFLWKCFLLPINNL